MINVMCIGVHICNKNMKYIVCFETTPGLSGMSNKLHEMSNRLATALRVHSVVNRPRTTDYG